MGLFTTTPIVKTTSESVAEIVESRKSFVAMFEAVKDGLEDDNEANQALQSDIESQIALLQGSLTTLKVTKEKNEDTIKELQKFIK
jgi:hypothetical protein